MMAPDAPTYEDLARKFHERSGHPHPFEECPSRWCCPNPSKVATSSEPPCGQLVLDADVVVRWIEEQRNELVHLIRRAQVLPQSSEAGSGPEAKPYDHRDRTRHSLQDCMDAIGRPASLTLTGLIVGAGESPSGPFIKFEIGERFGFPADRLVMDLDPFEFLDTATPSGHTDSMETPTARKDPS